MTEIIRSRDKIQQLIDAIQSDLDALPGNDAWGSPNAKHRRSLQHDIKKLAKTRDNSELPPDEYDEIRGWLTGASWATIGFDYGIQ